MSNGKLGAWVNRRANGFRYGDMIALALLYVVVALVYVGATAFSYYSGAWSEIVNNLKAKYAWSWLQPLVLMIFFSVVMKMLWPKIPIAKLAFLVVFLGIWFSLAPLSFIVQAACMLCYFASFVITGLIAAHFAGNRAWPVATVLGLGFVVVFFYTFFTGSEGAAARAFEKRAAAGMHARGLRADAPIDASSLYHAEFVDIRVATELAVGGKAPRRSKKSAVDWQYIPIVPAEADTARIRFMLFCEAHECQSLPSGSTLEGFVSVLPMRASGDDDPETRAERSRIISELREYGLKYEDALVVVRPGRLPDESLAAVRATTKRNLIWWTYFCVLVVALQFLLRRHRSPASLNA